jgi:hypothetical protein
MVAYLGMVASKVLDRRPTLNIVDWARWIQEQISSLGLEKDRLLQTMRAKMFERIKELMLAKRRRPSSAKESNGTNATPTVPPPPLFLVCTPVCNLAFNAEPVWRRRPSQLPHGLRVGS